VAAVAGGIMKIGEIMLAVVVPGDIQQVLVWQ
jgi:hypothetical protein